MPKSHIKPREVDRVLDFMTSMCQLLSLPPYTFVIMEEPTHSKHEAAIEPVENRWAAKLSLGVEWMDRDEYDRMKTLVHEVLHLVHREVDEDVRAAKAYMHDYEFASVEQHYSRHIELMVDHMAQLISEVPAVREAWLNS